MISSSTLNSATVLDLKTTRPLPLNDASALDFQKSSKQKAQLPHSVPENDLEHQQLNQHVNQVVEQQVSQVNANPIEIHQHKPLALNLNSTEPLLELIDLDDTINPQPSLHQHKPLALGQNTVSSSTAAQQHQPAALVDKPSSLDIQLLTEQGSALLIDPTEQLMNILQNLLKNTSQENPLYWIENNPSPAATEVAQPTATKPNLAWQESLWF